jgi:hypothetical protein
VTENAIAERPAPLDLALLKAVGWDRLAPEQRDLALAISQTYGLDPMLKHLVLIDGKPVVTRDGLLHVAHRSGVFDGIQVTQPVLVDTFWRCTATVWRKDMSHPFEYPGRFPDAGRKGRATEYAEEMAIKVAESMSLRRAFDVAAPVMEERWGTEPAYEPPTPKPTLAERAAEKAAAVKVIDLPEPEPIPDAVREQYVNADELAAGAPAVLRAEVSVGLSVDTFKDLCVKGGKSSVAIAKAIECTVDQVGARVKAMSPVERGVLADELNIDWRTA